MSSVATGLAIAVASCLLVNFVYRTCTTIGQIDEALLRWAKENGFRIIQKESRIFVRGPFFWISYRPVYFVTLEDQQHMRKRAWVRLGWWYFVGFREFVEVRWDE